MISGHFQSRKRPETIYSLLLEIVRFLGIFNHEGLKQCNVSVAETVTILM